MSILKIITLLAALLIHNISFADNYYNLTLSADRISVHSQQMGTDVAFSAIETIAYTTNNLRQELHLLQRIGLNYMTHMISSANHNIVGNGFRAVEFDGKINGIGVTPLGVSVDISIPAPYHLQKAALVALGGNESGYILSQKIAKQWIMTNSDIDPITGLGYVFSYGDQFRYSYFNKGLKNPELSSYSYYMELLYGKGSMKPEKVRREILLDILDPLFLTSAYAGIIGESVPLPILNLHPNLGILPFLRAIPTPYGVIQKKIGTYIFTDYTPIKFSFSFGRQSKKIDIFTVKVSKNQEDISYKIFSDSYRSTRSNQASNQFTSPTIITENSNDPKGSNYDMNDIDLYNDYSYFNDDAYFNYADYYDDNTSIISDKSSCSRSNSSYIQNKELLEIIHNITNEITIIQSRAKSYNIYTAELSIYKVFTTNNFNIGLDVAIWNQPKLFTIDSYKERPEFGFMLNLNTAYYIKNDLDITLNIGYKTTGFLPGYFIDKGIIFATGLRWRL